MDTHSAHWHPEEQSRDRQVQRHSEIVPKLPVGEDISANTERGKSEGTTMPRERSRDCLYRPGPWYLSFFGDETLFRPKLNPARPATAQQRTGSKTTGRYSPQRKTTPLWSRLVRLEPLPHGLLPLIAEHPVFFGLSSAFRSPSSLLRNGIAPTNQHHPSSFGDTSPR